MKLNKVYVPFRVPREELRQFMDDAAELGIKGLSVTIPHKEDDRQELTQADGAVRGIGAANTRVFEETAQIGYNTDYRAAMDSLEADHPGGRSAASSLNGKTALVLGAGGVSKAIVFGLLRRDAEVVIASRTFDRHAASGQTVQCPPVQWAERHTVEAEHVINATPIGMHPNVDESAKCFFFFCLFLVPLRIADSSTFGCMPMGVALMSSSASTLLRSYHWTGRALNRSARCRERS